MAISPKPTSLRLEPNIQRELDAAAKSMNRPKSWIIKQAIRHYLDERADLQEAIDKLQDPNTVYVDWEDVKDDI